MKKVLSAIIAMCIFSISFAEDRIYSGAKANHVISGVSLLRYKGTSTIPNFIKFKEGSEVSIENIQKWMTQKFNLNNRITFKLINEQKDKFGYAHYRFNQMIDGVPVKNGVYIVHTINGKVVSLNGELFPINIVENSEIAKSEDEALSIALNNVGATIYKWEDDKSEKHLKWEQNDNNATYFPSAEIVYVFKNFDINQKLRLAYKFNIYAHQPLSRQDVYIDVENGEVLWVENKIHHVDEVGTAQTAYSGSQVMTSDNMGGGSYRLQETGRGNGIRTFNCNQSTNYTNTDFTNNSVNWNLSGIDAHATDAHWGAEMTYDYFFNKHGRNSIDGNGFRLDSYVHYDQNFGNAFWDGQRMTYGDGSSGNSPFTALDIAGHEITHGLTTFTADLVYQGESGALNESFSDIFGVSVEFIARPGNSNWLMGEDLGFTIRNMSNPNSTGDPDTYEGNNWVDVNSSNDNGGVHTNSGVQNYWYYLLVDGGSGTNDNGDSYTVNPLGLDAAGEIAFRNLTVYLTTNSDYSDARFFSIQSAADIYGPCTPEVQEVTNAWYAVGVGSAYVPYTVSDFEACLTESCSVPFSVDFNNMSVNATNFTWDFGDGGSSSSLNPTHTFTDYGVYTVELYADGGMTCGDDTTTKVAYITIDSNIACKTIMPSSGNTVLSQCSGTLFDSGGPCNIYGANQTAQVTISPTGAGQVHLNFIMFDIEAGDQGGTICNYDNMKIYDGPSTSSPLIGTFCNNNLPSSTISSSGSSITILFTSDPGLEKPGFEIEWSCDVATAAPVVDFTVDLDTTCTGEVNFTDLSSNGPISWDWDFGDGNSSNLQNPSHVYTSPGLYTVQLTSTNAIGSGSDIKTNFIFIDMPAPPSVQGDSICSDNVANLSASGNGTVKWYDSPSSSSALTTGTTYTTPSLTNTTTYYVEDFIPAQLQNLGKTDNSGGGGYLDNEQYLIFDAYQDMFIQSVDVYAQSSGSRVVQLKDKFGNVINQKTQSVSAGLKTIYLLFPVPAGTDYQLVLSGNSSVRDLYRNNSGVTYPYTLNGVGSITNSSAGTSYYYYFYNWQVKGQDCTSPRVPVTAEVVLCTGISDIVNQEGINSYYNASNQNLNIIMKDVDSDLYTINIYNSVGQIVYIESVNVNQSTFNKNVDLNEFSKGMYFVNIKSKSNTYTNRFIK